MGNFLVEQSRKSFCFVFQAFLIRFPLFFGSLIVVTLVLHELIFAFHEKQPLVEVAVVAFPAQWVADRLLAKTQQLDTTKSR